MTVSVPEVTSSTPSGRAGLSGVGVTLVAVAVFVFVAEYVVQAGYLRRDIEALQAGEAWRTGGWLSQLVLSLVGQIPNLDVQQGILSFATAVVSGLLFGLIYVRLRQRSWMDVTTVLLLAAVACHALVLFQISAGSRSLPTYVAIAAMIVATRELEAVGDVKAAMAIGLLVPLLLLAGPATALLVVPFVLATALADREARRDPRAFIAMLLVAGLPTIIVAVAIVGFAVQANFDLVGLLLPYLAAYADLRPGNWQGALLDLFVYAPVALVPLAYCVVPQPGEPRRVWSALLVVLLPAYLAVGNAVFPWNLPAHAPAVALLAAFLSWLTVVRLSFAMRVASVVLLLAAVAASWTWSGGWDDPAWKAALVRWLPLGF